MNAYLNRGLLLLCLLIWLGVVIWYFPYPADVIIVVISTIVIVMLSLFPEIKIIPQQTWFQSRSITAVLSAISIIGLITYAFLWIQPNWGLLIGTDETSCTFPLYVFQESAGTVVMEAEHCSYKIPGSGPGVGDRTWEIIAGENYIDGYALRAQPVQGRFTLDQINGPVLIYRINFKAKGEYYVDIRGAAPSGRNNDSIHVGISGQPVTASDPNGTGVAFAIEEPSWVHEYCGRAESDGRRRCLEMLPVIINIPEPGTYNLFLWMREDGVVVDRIILSRALIPDLQDKDNLQESPRVK